MLVHKVVGKRNYKSSKYWRGEGNGGDVKRLLINIDETKKQMAHWKQRETNPCQISMFMQAPTKSNKHKIIHKFTMPYKLRFQKNSS
jgi:hypothetical protein